jgi:hypothetical protein
MRGYRVGIKKVHPPSMAPSSAKSRELSIPPGLDPHTPVGLELSSETCPDSLLRGLLRLLQQNFIIITESPHSLYGALPACWSLLVAAQPPP